MDADSAKAEYESVEENTDITIPFTFTEPEITTEKMNANGRIHNVGLTGIYLQRTDRSAGRNLLF